MRAPAYSEASPIRPAPAAPLPDVRAVGERVYALHRRWSDGAPAYSYADICGSDSYEGIVPAYFRVAAVATVDPLLLVAQMVHETAGLTSWHAARPRRNPAGIFVTGATRTTTPPAREGDIWQPRGPGQWVRGGRWSNWVSSPGHPWRGNSVDAHAWRVAGYALARLSDTQQAAYVQACEGRPLPLWVRGSALVWRELGAKYNRARLLGGGWANPGDDYGRKLAQLANELTKGLI